MIALAVVCLLDGWTTRQIWAWFPAAPTWADWLAVGLASVMGLAVFVGAAFWKTHADTRAKYS